MDPIDYCFRITNAREPYEEQIIMAKIALNALVDPEAYPVSLSEMEALSSEANILSRSMLSYCAMHPRQYGSLAGDLCLRLVGMVRQHELTQAGENLSQEIGDEG